MTAARDVYRVAGSPPMEGCEDVAAACVVCAAAWWLLSLRSCCLWLAGNPKLLLPYAPRSLARRFA